MKNLIIYLSIIFLFSSCYFYKDGKLTPLYGWYKLKCKNTIVPERLDTNNLYKLKKRYKNEELVYTDSMFFNDKNKFSNQFLRNGNLFIKFYSDGRCQKIITLREELNGNYILVKEDDLNPKNSQSSFGYYYFIDTINFQIETFTKGDGGGAYVILDYELSQDGKNIFYRDKYVYEEYELIEIPEEWKRYDYYW